jgi:hypothetical protein
MEPLRQPVESARLYFHEKRNPERLRRALSDDAAALSDDAAP